jgi:4-hydroxythreonine-4-phosphate dehydrogenase
MQVIAVADDLSGATETLAALGLWGSRVWLNTKNPKLLLNEIKDHQNLVIDSNCRQLSPEKTRLQLRDIANVLTNLPKGSVVFRKVDSLLRGNLAQIVEEAQHHGPVIVAVANPATGRTTVGGVVYVNGTPLDQTELWEIEGRKPWSSIAESIAPLSSRVIPIETIRSGQAKLLAALTDAFNAGAVSICDSQTAEDLDLVAEAALAVERVQIVGTAGLARAVSKNLKLQSLPSGMPKLSTDEICVLVGSAAQASARQIDKLSGMKVSTFKLNDEKTRFPSLSEIGNASLVLTGGETARRVLDALDVNWIRPFSEIETGVVTSQTNDGKVVVIKPGSYGDDLALVRAVNFISELPTE